MKKYIYLFLFTFLFTSSQSQSWQWASRFGGLSTGPNNDIPDESIKDMVVDAEGNVYFCGTIRQPANANGTILTTYGQYDIIVGKLNCHGDLIWVKTAGGTSNDHAQSLCLDLSGNLYVTGYIYATQNIPCNLFGTIITESTDDLYITKMDTSGVVLWNKIAAPGIPTLSSFPYSLSIDQNGDIFLLFRVGVNGGEIFTGDTVARGVWLAKLDASGIVTNKFQISPTAFAIRDYTLSNTSDHYFVANFSGADSVIIGGQTTYHINPNITYADILLFKFNDTGNLQWLEQIGVTNNAISCNKLLLDANDNIFISGAITNGVIFGTDTMQNLLGAGTLRFPFMAKYNAQGQSLWGVQASAQYVSDATGGIAELPNGNLVWSGYFQGNAIFGTTNLSSSSSGLKDIFLSEVDPLGNILNVEVLPCTGFNEEPECLISDTAGNIYMGGGFHGTMTLNGNTYTSAGGATDAFVAKYGYICTVGLDETENKSPLSINIYPNPASEIIQINSVEYNFDKLTIINILGAVVMELNPDQNGQIVSINIKNLQPGVYLVQLKGKDGLVSGKFVKKE